jgi:hypothetical protein
MKKCFFCVEKEFFFFLTRSVLNLRDGAASGLNILFTFIISREMFLKAFYGTLFTSYAARIIT